MQPDFVLFRQVANSEKGNYTNTVIALLKGESWKILLQSSKPRYPVVLRVGHGSHGLGKVKIDDENHLLEVENMLRAVGPIEVLTEPFIETKYDIHLQKIGSETRAYIRKGISNDWKSNASSAMLEKISLSNSSQRVPQQMMAARAGQVSGGPPAPPPRPSSTNVSRSSTVDRNISGM
ncbi:unnamed protein product [Gongylonema pulchrum]|uniref:Synapsin_C domain-containing protein n=1 Tax=Gongylonema pulchrum TaxID=637853 RepID=A0A183EJ24_9BILA|nr:unnamed protein product [Gongylonema pulchrum]